MSAPRFTLEPIDLDRDLDLLHRWVTHPRSRFWMMQDASRDDVRANYAAILADSHHRAWLGRNRGRPAFLAETYDPARAVEPGLAGLPELAPGDIGMHLLVAPPDLAPEPGFTSAVFEAVVRHCFADPSVRRIVVEPDVRNQAIRAKNVAAGFVELRELDLGEKSAMFSVCTREAFEAAAVVDHLVPTAMRRAQRHLVAKAIAEYTHERLIAPVPDGEAADRWAVETPRSRYTFTARRHPLEHWVIDESSLARSVAGEAAPLDAQELIAELSDVLGIPARMLPVYLEEIAATLAAACWKDVHGRRPVGELVRAVSTAVDPALGYQLIEAAMTEGHPGFVANNGRIGFGVDDYRAYAPETGSEVRLEWVAARREHSTLSLAAGLSETDLYDGQLGEDTVARFRRRLEALGLDPADYVFLPVHPWQWTNKLAVTFAPDLARRDLVHLGAGESGYRAQQSIRTFFDATAPEKHYVKTALSIQNMGFMRGLSPSYMRATPAINDWVGATLGEDPALRACGFDILPEVAAIGYTGDAFHRLAESSAHQKMIAGLWRQSPIGRIDTDERLATMASLLHRDADGDAFVTALVKSSPVDAATWVGAYLTAYLRPLVHCLLAYDLVFMPHGENLVLRLRDGVPTGVFLKDIGEEVAVLTDRPLPEEVERIRSVVPADVGALAIHTDVMDGVLRYVAAILAEDGLLPAEQFWTIARGVIVDHVTDNPDLARAAARYDLLRAEFKHSCLNRLQLRNTLEMVDIGDQAESLQFAGMLANPLTPGARST